MKRRFRIDNKGYSLVELIIVMAIVVVLSLTAFVSITIINSAKAKEATVSLDMEIAAVADNAKSKMPNFVGMTAGTQYHFCIKIYKDSNGRFYAQRGYLDSSSGYYTVPAENASDGKGVCLSSRISVKYDNYTSVSDLSTNEAYIEFDKSGRCVSGDGKYIFYKKNGSKYGTVVVNKNGSHKAN